MARRREHALGLRRARRAAERRQVDARQRDRRAQGRDRLRQAADHAPRDPRRGDADDVPARARRPAGRAAPARRADARACSAAWSRSSREADAALLVVNGEQGVGGRGDRFIAEALRAARRAGRRRRQQDRPPRPHAHGRARCRPPPTSGSTREVFPISARTGTGVGPLVDHLAALLPEGPFFFPPEERLRPARERAARRAGPRAGPAAHPPGGAARGRGPGRGDRGARRRSSPCARCCGSRPSRRRAS